MGSRPLVPILQAAKVTHNTDRRPEAERHADELLGVMVGVILTDLALHVYVADATIEVSQCEVALDST